MGLLRLKPHKKKARWAMNDTKKRNIQGTIVAFILGLLLGGLGTITMVARELMQAYKYDFDVECDDIIRYSITASVGSVIQLLILTLWIL